MTLTKKLTKVGNSWAIILPQDMMQSIGLEPESECELISDENEIILRPHQKVSSKDKKIAQATLRFIQKYRKDLQKMA